MSHRSHWVISSQRNKVVSFSTQREFGRVAPHQNRVLKNRAIGQRGGRQTCMALGADKPLVGATFGSPNCMNKSLCARWVADLAMSPRFCTYHPARERSVTVWQTGRCLFRSDLYLESPGAVYNAPLLKIPWALHNARSNSCHPELGSALPAFNSRGFSQEEPPIAKLPATSQPRPNPMVSRQLQSSLVENLIRHRAYMAW